LSQENTMSDTPTAPSIPIADAQAAPPPETATTPEAQAETPPPAPPPEPPPPSAPPENPPADEATNGRPVTVGEIKIAAARLKADAQAAEAAGDIAPLVSGFIITGATLGLALADRLEGLIGRIVEISQDYVNADSQAANYVALEARLTALEAPRAATDNLGITSDGTTVAGQKIAAAASLIAELRAGGQIGGDLATTLEAILAASDDLNLRASATG
jgi:hypothetical protein